MEITPHSGGMIDRTSPIPAYLQIAYSISQRILDEEWRVGDQIPPENTLAELYSASRVTIRQALARLEEDGLISRQQGRGAFVLSLPRYNVQELQLPDSLSGQHPIMSPESQVRSTNIRITELESVNNRAVRMLALPEGSPLLYLERWFESGGKVVGINRAWFPKERFPDLAERGLIGDSVSTTLSAVYHCDTVAVENYIEAVILDAGCSKILQAPYASPALRIDSVHFTHGHIPIEYASTIWNGTNTQFHLLVSQE